MARNFFDLGWFKLEPMTFFFLVGIIFTLLIAGGAVLAWSLIARRTGAGKGKRRHREEARQLQERFEADEDFNHNFHRPTQNELLETLQALDHLAMDWQKGDAELVDHRFKNELAESFPALCKAHSTYPKPVAEDLARLFGKAKLSPESRAERQRRHDDKVSQARTAFHSIRAHANAMHQITSGPTVGPVAVTAGSLPFRVREESLARARRGSSMGKLAVGAALVVCLLTAGWYGSTNAKLRDQFFALVHGDGPSNMTEVAGKPASATSGGVADPATSQPVSATASTTEAAAPAKEGPTAPTPTPAGTPAIAQTEPAPPPTPASAAPPAATAPPPLTLAQRIAISQQRAVEKHPELATPDSEINLRFIFRYKKLAEEHSPRLQDPNWPEKLADECAAAAAGAKGKKPVPVNTARR